MSLWNSLRHGLRGRPQPRHGRDAARAATEPAIAVPYSWSAWSRPYTTLDEAARLPRSAVASRLAPVREDLFAAASSRS